MPSTSQAQHRLMQAVAHDPKFAAKVGIKQSVGKDFEAADKGLDMASLPARKPQTLLGKVGVRK